jgi:hypothetical protein
LEVADAVVLHRTIRHASLSFNCFSVTQVYWLSKADAPAGLQLQVQWIKAAPLTLVHSAWHAATRGNENNHQSVLFSSWCSWAIFKHLNHTYHCAQALLKSPSWTWTDVDRPRPSGLGVEVRYFIDHGHRRFSLLQASARRPLSRYICKAARGGLRVDWRCVTLCNGNKRAFSFTFTLIPPLLHSLQ